MTAADATAAPQPVVSTAALTLSAGGRRLLQPLDWTAHRGERWCVIGRNGAGKSTLLRALAGLPVPAQAGRVSWLGRDAQRWPPQDAARVRAFVPQHPQDRFHLSVRHVLELAQPQPTQRQSTQQPGSLGGRMHEDRLADELRRLDVAHLLDRSLMALSGGERQRVALAACAAQRPALMLLDEPVAFQDPGHRLAVARWMRERSDVALVFTAHDPLWIGQVATHVLALLDDGAVQAGPAQQVLGAATLERVYGCRFEAVGGGWLPVDR